jgi:hypothetical protein
MSTPKPKPVVGQTMYSLNIGNAARRNEQKLTPTIVRKVGNKYFSCSTEIYPDFVTEFTLDTWWEKTGYCKNQRLYASPQEWEDEKERDEIVGYLRKLFDWSANPSRNITLDQLRAIKKMLNPQS